jgi:adenylylsulfate kinase
MTGISAPYEPPENPDFIIETDRYPLDQCVDLLLQFLMDRKIIVLRETGRGRRLAV